MKNDNLIEKGVGKTIRMAQKIIAGSDKFNQFHYPKRLYFVLIESMQSAGQ